MASNFDEHGGVPGVEFTSPVLTAVYGQSRWIFKQLLRACALAQWLKDTPVAATAIDAAFTAYQAQANGLSTLAKTVSALARTHKCPVSMWNTSGYGGTGHCSAAVSSVIHSKEALMGPNDDLLYNKETHITKWYMKLQDLIPAGIPIWYWARAHGLGPRALAMFVVSNGIYPHAV
jgi:hypothetical protein